MLSAWFAGSETVFLSFNRARLQAWLHSGKRSARVIWRLTDRPERFVATVLIGNNLVMVVYSSLLALYLSRHSVSGEIIFVATPILLLIVGEAMPKAIARQVADETILTVGAVLAGFRILFFPVAKPLEISVAWLTGRSGSADSKVDDAPSRAEIVSLLRSAGGRRTASGLSDDILLRILHLIDLRVSDIMTPRTSITAINDQSSVDEACRAILDSGHTRIPVYRDNIDNIIGLVAAQDLLRPHTDLSSVLRPMKTVPESMRVIDLLTWLKRNRVSLVAVIDEYGGIAGVVGLEDLTRELVGPTRDEYDSATEGIVQMSGMTWIVRGYSRLSQVQRVIEIDFGSTSAHSMGGLVTKLAGGIPAAGTEFGIAAATLRVISARSNSVDLVRITKHSVKINE